MVLLPPYEEMSSHLKLHMETFPYFARWFYCLILTFHQVNKTGNQKLIHNC